MLRKTLVRIAEQIHRITRIIGNLRAFARQEKTATDLVDLVDITRHALTLVEGDIASNSVNLELELPDQALIVLAGRVRLEQVVLNLVSNALDAMQVTQKTVF